MAKRNDDGRKLKGYYPFQKKYPTKRGNTYEIGESRKMKAKERNMRIIIAVVLLCLFLFTYLVLSVCHKLATRPLPESQKIENQIVTIDSIFNVKGVFLENNILQNGETLDDALKNARKCGYNAIMVDLKDRDGNLLYNSNLLNSPPQVKKTKISPQIVEKIKSEGFLLIGRVFCFEDTIAPQRLNAYVYKDFETKNIWLDNSPVLDGRTWLNPANSSAREYLYRVIREISNTDVDCIYLQSVEFPTKWKDNIPVFTENDEELNKNLILLDFINSAVQNAGTKPLILGTDFDCILRGNEEKYGGTLTDSSAVLCSPFVEKEENTPYIDSIHKEILALNECVKNNFTTIKAIPTIKSLPFEKAFLDELNEKGAETYIIVP